MTALEGTKRCPFCAEEVQVAALVCRFCRMDLRTGRAVAEAEAPPPAAPSPAPPTPAPKGNFGRSLALVSALIVLSVTG